MKRRQNHALRELIAEIEVQVLNRGMCLERAAELMLEHGAPSAVAVRILTRVQQRPLIAA